MPLPPPPPPPLLLLATLSHTEPTDTAGDSRPPSPSHPLPLPLGTPVCLLEPPTLPSPLAEDDDDGRLLGAGGCLSGGESTGPLPAAATHASFGDNDGCAPGTIAVRGPSPPPRFTAAATAATAATAVGGGDGDGDVDVEGDGGDGADWALLRSSQRLSAEG